MKKFLLPLAALLCACSPPKLVTEGDIQVHITDTPGTSGFTYPKDAVSQQKLADWLSQHEQQRCTYCFMQYVPVVTLNFPNNCTVYFYHESVHVSPVSMRQYIRDITPEDAAFCQYLITIAPPLKSHE